MEKIKITEKDIIYVRELSYQIEKYNLYEMTFSVHFENLIFHEI